jgi:CBS domain containing-hemolysin-like protein
VLIAFGVALLVMLILANGYFVAAEFSYVAVNRGRLEELARRATAARSGRWASPAGCPSCCRGRSSGSPSRPCS